MNVREIIVYSVGAGVFVFVILLCIVYQCRNKSYKTESRRERNKQDTSSPDVPLEDIEGIYEQIDESNMIDNHANVRFSRGTSPGKSQSYCQRNCNVYLTPHQSGGEGSNSNNFNGNKSGSEKQMKESRNLNPYQPIMISVRDSHEYESLH
ncbi:unnamed protein product [Mytilus coruscus]|uniref:Uncharacterized protein n=1 Tax=Mytilus coruscus TaxID=42192 RepID=A0A6J8BHS4_MYTCO|nr:unnamed protein product [Mytilus coruscus]